MKLSIIAAFTAVLCLAYFAQAQESNGADQSNQVKMSGVLIDQHCAGKMEKKANPQQAAAEHEKSCAIKCGVDDGYEIMSDGKLTKLSADSKDKVTDYLKEDNSTTSVTIEGSKDANGEIKVSSITPAEKTAEPKGDEMQGQ